MQQPDIVDSRKAGRPPSEVRRGNPFALWVEEPDKAVWHRSTGRVERTLFRAACGWQLDARHGRLWPQGPGDPGPRAGSRCHSCVG